MIQKPLTQQKGQQSFKTSFIKYQAPVTALVSLLIEWTFSYQLHPSRLSPSCSFETPSACCWPLCTHLGCPCQAGWVFLSAGTLPSTLQPLSSHLAQCSCTAAPWAAGSAFLQELPISITPNQQSKRAVRQTPNLSVKIVHFTKKYVFLLKEKAEWYCCLQHLTK